MSLSPEVRARLRLAARTALTVLGSVVMLGFVIATNLVDSGLGRGLVTFSCFGLAFAPFVGAAALFEALKLHRRDLRLRRETQRPETF